MDLGARRNDRRAGGRQRHGRVRFATTVVVLMLLVGAAALTPTVIRIGQAIVSMPAQLLGAMLQGIGAAAQAAVQQAFEAVAESDAVKAKLGEPLVLPAAEQVTWSDRPANAPTDELDLQFLVTGPNGAAEVTATLKTTESNLEISRLVVTPIDGSEPIIVRPAPE
jgi:hypothetical protein